MRRHVVFPDPEGPSSVKNSPSAISKLTPSTARTAPNAQVTASNATAVAMSGTARATHPGRAGGRRVRLALLAAAQDRDVVRHPAIVRHAFAALGLAVGDRRAPEVDLLEAAEAVALAALIGEQRVALACVQHNRHGAEPGGEITLQLDIERVLEPHICAVRMLRLNVHHGGIGPPGHAFLWHHGGHRT